MVEVLPGEGGGPVTGSPGDVIIVFQHQSEQLVGGTQLQRVVEVGCRSLPSLVFFQFRLNALGYTRAVGAAYASGYAMLIEGLLTVATISDVSYRQDLSAAGQLIDQFEVFWHTADDSADGSVVMPMTAADSDSVLAAVGAAMAAFA